MKRLTSITILLLTVYSCIAPPYTVRVGKPKLVVGIIVDQMRNDYLYRYYDKFGEGGFKRFVDKGFVLKNGHYNYIPTSTGPGHASVYTGTTPANHGVIGNGWYDKTSKRSINCVEDTTVITLGNDSNAGLFSPKNLLATTISDALKLSNNLESKVIGISLKNRGAILPAGGSADGAYWYDWNNGMFVSSTYYHDKLPGWVIDFNDRKLTDEYLNQTWNTLLPISEYTESGPDDTPYERKFRGKELSTFPYDLSSLKEENGGYNLLGITPFGNAYVKEMAIAAVEGAAMGQDEVTDLLAISFSSTDIVGHSYGPFSVEVEDIYLRLDKDLSDLFSYLDQEVGENEYLVFLTADHGVVEVPQFMVDNKLPGGYFTTTRENQQKVRDYLQNIYGPGDWVENFSNNQVFLNRNLIQNRSINLQNMQRKVADLILGFEGISNTYTANEIVNTSDDGTGIRNLVYKGYNMERSGDVMYTLRSGWLSSSSPQGTSHGSGYNYDTHVPILFYGWGIPHGETVIRYNITDIAPTLSMLLDIQLPSMSTGKPIEELF